MFEGVPPQVVGHCRRNCPKRRLTLHNRIAQPQTSIHSVKAATELAGIPLHIPASVRAFVPGRFNLVCHYAAPNWFPPQLATQANARLHQPSQSMHTRAVFDMCGYHRSYHSPGWSANRPRHSVNLRIVGLTLMQVPCRYSVPKGHRGCLCEAFSRKVSLLHAIRMRREKQPLPWNLHGRTHLFSFRFGSQNFGE